MKNKGRQAARLAAGALAAAVGLSPCLSAGMPGFGALTVLGNQEDVDALDFAFLRNKWNELLTGEGVLNQSSRFTEDYVKSVEERASRHWDTMIKLGDAGEDERTCLWADYPMNIMKPGAITNEAKSASSQVTLTYDRLKAIALAYETEGTSFYHDETVWKELIAALDMMEEGHYSVEYACNGTGTGLGSGNKSFGNWYDWRIGTPRQLCDLLLMLCGSTGGNSLSEEQISRYTAPVLANNKKVDTTGANRTWIASIYIQCGILRGEKDLIEQGKTGLKDVFRYVDTGDGFHRDGSFIQHNHYAYTGGYGKALLCTLAPLMYVLNDTDCAIEYEDGCESMLYDMIFEAYEPLIYGGRFMDMAREREISRIANQDSIPGRQAIRSIIMLSDVLPDEKRERAMSMLKEWLSDDQVMAQVCVDPLEGYNEYYLPAGVIGMAMNIRESDAVPRGSLIRHKRYGAMDRVVHLRDKFGFTVSMSSDRIYNTEGTNNEGLRLWNIGDGLTYLYTPDKTWYSDNYWATVDYQRLPGTTENIVPGRGEKAGYATKNSYKYAGGTDLGEYGIAGLEVQGVGDTKRNGAHARKSWFMFDDEVVALGSDIRSSLSGSEVDTTVENRKVALDKSNTLTVNGKEQSFEDKGEIHTEENKSLNVTTVTAASGQDVTAKKALSGLSANGKVTVSCKVKMPSATDYFALKLYGSGSAEGAEENIVFLTMRNNAMVPRIPNTGNKDAYNKDASLTAGRWHELKLELDMGSQTFNYYFDGQHITEGSSVDGNTVDANLENAAFYNTLSGGSNTLTAFEIMAPGSKSGTILVDDIKVQAGGADAVYAEDFEAQDADQAVSGLDGWSVKVNDKGEGAGAWVELEQQTVLPESEDDFNGVHEDTEWIHLAGETEGSDVGYYFPGKADITGVRETRLGSWDQVNTYEKFTDSGERMNSFVTFWFDHGEKPEDASYSYVLLPGMSAEETADYNENPDIEVLAQTDSIHAVREKNLDITGINFFEAGKYGAFTAKQPQSVMYQEYGDGTAEISFADPTQSLKTMELKVELPVSEVIEADEGVSAEMENGCLLLSAKTDNPKGQAGASFTVKVRLGGADNMFETQEVGTTPENWTAEGGSAQVAAMEDGSHALRIAAQEEEAQAVTELSYPESESGSTLTFMLKPESGSGSVMIGDEEGSHIEVPFAAKASQKRQVVTDAVEGTDWHTVKVKLDGDGKTYHVSVDGKWYTDTLEDAAGELERFAVKAEAGSSVFLDNLNVYASYNIPPTTPQGLTYTGYGDTYVDLKWDEAQSENPVSYILSINGEELEEPVAGTAFRAEGLEPETDYTFQVKAADSDENVSEYSNELHVTTLELQKDRYVVRFDDYNSGSGAQGKWEYGGADPKGVAEIKEAPAGKDDDTLDQVISDLEYWKEQAASPSDAKRATGSNARRASASDAAYAEPEKDQALYLYSGTSGKDKTAAYTFEKQTEKQTYRVKLYFDESVKYSNFALMGTSGGKDVNAVTMMVSDNGIIGYRAGDDPNTTKELLDAKTEDEWVEFVITADPKTQTFSISANGTEKTGLTFRNAVDNITKIKFSAPSKAVGGFYVDDIVIPADNSDEKLKLTALTEEPEELTVPFGTGFYELGLPETLSVTAENKDGESSTMEIRVNWDKADYDPETPGLQTIHGTLACPANCDNRISGSQIKAKVTVEKEIKVFHVTLSQTAGGTITADAKEAPEGTWITLEAQPDEGYRLAGWMLNGRRIDSTELSYSFELTEDTTASAVFEAEAPQVKYYAVTAEKDLTGGSLKLSSSYAPEGTEITVTAIPDGGYELRALKVNGRTVTADEDLSYTFELKRDTAVTAVFARISSGSGSSGGDDSDIGIFSQAAAPSYAVSGSWSSDNGAWSFKKADGTPVVSSWACILWNGSYEWFYFDEKGAMRTGWVDLDGRSYYLQPQSDGSRGRMLTGWQQIDGKWYYFNTVSDGFKGSLLKNTTTPDGYQVGEDGSWIQ